MTHFKTKLVTFLLLISACFIAWADDKTDVENAYNTWCNTISSAKTAGPIVQLYAPDATLLPTLSSKILKNTNGGLNGYFNKLVSNKDFKCTPQTLMTNVYGDIAVNSGFYDFSYKVASDGGTKLIPSRFTFVYQKYSNGKWMIVTHHSSVVPRGN